MTKEKHEITDEEVRVIARYLDQQYEEECRNRTSCTAVLVGVTLILIIVAIIAIILFCVLGVI